MVAAFELLNARKSAATSLNQVIMWRIYNDVQLGTYMTSTQKFNISPWYRHNIWNFIQIWVRLALSHGVTRLFCLCHTGAGPTSPIRVVDSRNLNEHCQNGPGSSHNERAAGWDVVQRQWGSGWRAIWGSHATPAPPIFWTAHFGLSVPRLHWRCRTCSGKLRPTGPCMRRDCAREEEEGRGWISCVLLE
jgi:hypothetical protein